METTELDEMQWAIRDRLEDNQITDDYPRPPDLFSEIDRMKRLFRSLETQTEGNISYA